MAVIHDGGIDAFNATVYGEQHPNVQTFLQGQAETFSNNLTDMGRQFSNRANDIYERLNNSTALRRAKAMVRKGRSLWNTDDIRQLSTIGEFQQAGLKMQRWLMAEPTVRKMAHEQKCHGWSDTYVDMHPNDIGKEHYDWRRVMDGVFVEDEYGELYANTYLDEVIEGDNLDIVEQDEILTSWHELQQKIRDGGDDPTSPLNSSL